MKCASPSLRIIMYTLAIFPSTLRAFISFKSNRLNIVAHRAAGLIFIDRRISGCRLHSTSSPTSTYTSTSLPSPSSSTSPSSPSSPSPSSPSVESTPTSTLNNQEANINIRRKEKRPRTKPDTAPALSKPPTPLKFANVKACDISQVAGLEFDTIIDVRTPAEFEIDHLPGSVNHPVLDNEERIVIGTLHNGNVFEARRRGAALISRHVADLLENEFKDMPKTWRPLVLCWRGGLRSGSLAIVLAQVGWQVHQLTGGYKAYRKEVTDTLPILCEKAIFKIVSAPTGSGKTHFLGALKRAGLQVIDLEGLACHRGSVLGSVPGEKQPSQRMFDTRLLLAFQQLDITKPIYIESESRKIGTITLPESLSKRMHESECLFMDVPKTERVKVLLEDYLYFIQNPDELIEQLQFLVEYRGVEKVTEWTVLIRNGDFPEFVSQLLDLHYDPLYWKSLRKNYPQIDDREVTQQLIVTSLKAESLDEAVTRIEERNFKYAVHAVSSASSVSEVSDGVAGIDSGIEGEGNATGSHADNFKEESDFEGV